MITRKKFLVSFHVEANQGYCDFDGPAQYREVPVRVSIPLAPGICSPADHLELRDEHGTLTRRHTRAFLLWPDGSVRAWELWFPVTLRRATRMRFDLHLARRPPPAPPRSAFHGWNEDLRFILSVKLGNGSRLKTAIPLAAGNRELFSETGQKFLLDGAPGGARFRGDMLRRSWSWYPGHEYELRVINHGDDETLTVRGVRLEFDLPGAGTPRYCVRQSCFLAEGHPRLVERRNPFDVRADHEGIHVTDLAQLGEDENDYPPYERGMYLGAVGPWTAMADREAGWAMVIPDAHERMPKGWKIAGHKAVLDLHPEDSPPLEWRQGMAIFQRFTLLRLPSRTTPAEFENDAQAWLRPAIVRLDPEVYREAGWRIPFRYEPERFPRTEFEFRDSFNFSWTRGTFHWGDQIAGTKGGGPIAPGSKGIARNLEYDFVAVAAKEYARTGVTHLLKLCRASAEHMMHTDFVDLSNDPWKQGGIVHHCPDHTTGSAYPSHMWAEGLTLYHQLTGDRHALHVAKRVGDFYLKYIRERFQVVQSTGREVGWTLIALSAIHDLTREARYLEGIRRVVDHNLERGWKRFFPTDACFTVGVGIIGFDRTRHFHRDRETRRFILDLLDWMMKDRRDALGLFEYWRDPEQGAIPYVQTHLPEALNIGYRLSGDERYLLAAFRLFQIHKGGGPLTVQNRYSLPECGFAAGHHISWMGCLQSFAEKGWLDKIQYPDPRIACKMPGRVRRS